MSIDCYCACLFVDLLVRLERGREIKVELRLLEMSSSSRSFLVNIDISILVIPLCGRVYLGVSVW